MILHEQLRGVNAIPVGRLGGRGGYWLRGERSGPESIWSMIADMRFFHHAFLLVPLLAAIAGAAPLDLFDVPVRAAHRVTVTVPDLHWAALEGDVAEVKRLIAAGADVNASETVYGGERALHWAVQGGSGVVRALIAAGANLEARDDQGETALFEALRVSDDDNYAALLALLVGGASVTAKRTDDGATALHLAVGYINSGGGARAVLLLRGFGADPNATMTYALVDDTSITGVTPLHLAALRPMDRFWGGFLRLASLDAHGRALQMNAKDSNGQTALHWLVAKVDSAWDAGVMGWLIGSGADVNTVDNRGATPLDWADASGNLELAAILRQSGGVNRFTGGTGGGTAPPPPAPPPGGGGAIPPAPPPAPPPFRPQPVEVALGENGGNITLMTTEAGGFTLNGEAFTGGPANPVEGEGGRMYVLTLTDGTWSAALVP